MVNIKLKEQRGFTGVDIMVAIMIIIIAIAIITNLGFQIYINSQAVKRNAEATSYAISILEKVDELYYDEVTQDNLKLDNIPSRIQYSNRSY